MKEPLLFATGALTTAVFLVFALVFVWVVRYMTADFLAGLDRTAMVGILAFLYALIVVVLVLNRD